MTVVIGIDLGGTKIQGVLMNEKFEVLKKYKRLTEPHKSKKEILNNIVEVINELKTSEIEKVGVGVPGSYYNKSLFFCPNIIKLVGCDIKKELEKKTKLKIIIENDANCFVVAEQKRGSAKKCKNAIGVIIGTGVGVGIIINNQLYSGSTNAAGEAGHSKLIIDYKIREVESLISGPSIVKRYEFISKKKASDPRVILNKKDEVAKQIYDETVLYTGIFLSNLIRLLNPECIVLGGGVSNLPYYKDIRKIIDKNTSNIPSKACKIKKNALGDDSGVIGAALLALEDCS